MPFNLEKLEERGARWANILAAIPGFYCASVLWEQRHDGGGPPVSSPPFVVALVAFIVCIVLGAVLNFALARKPREARVIGELQQEIQQLKDKSFSILNDGVPIVGPAAFEAEARRLQTQHNTELERARERCTEEKREYAILSLEHRDRLARYADEQRELQKQVEDAKARLAIFSPLQLEAFTLARDLRDFHASLDPYPEIAPQRPDEPIPEWLVRYTKAQGEQSRWDLKVLHGYANRKFGERITALMHRAGEEFDYPSHVPNYAEKITGGPNAIPALAQQMDMLAMWINRKVRNEVDLLHEKP